MANSISIEKAKPSKVRRLKFLPRLGVTIELGGRQITFRHAPIFETLLNVFDRGLSFKNLIEVSREQLREIEIPKLKSSREGAMMKPNGTEKTEIQSDV